MYFVNRGIGSRIEEIEENGTEYIVAPAVLLNETILEGHPEGDVFISEDELRDSPQKWNDTVVTIGHPRKSGQPVSAKKRDVKKNKLVGRVQNARFDGKLKADLLLNKNKLNQSESGDVVLKKINNGERIELSTGYISDSVETNRKDADAEHINIVPDHLALLPRSTGKCSIEDGCGVPRVNVLSTSRTGDSLLYDDAESADWSEVDKNLEDYVESYFEFTDNNRDDFETESFSTVESLPQEIKQWIAQKTLLGDSQADNVRNLIYFPVVNPNTNNLNENALDAVISGRGESADIDDKTIVSAQGVARVLLESDFGREFDDNMEDKVMDENEVADSVWKKMKEYFNSKQEEKEMAENSELIDSLCDNESVPFSCDELEEMETNQLESLNEQYSEQVDEDSEQNEQSEKDEPDTNEDETEDDGLNINDDDVEMLEEIIESRRDHKQRLISDLSENARCQYNEDELEQKSMGELEKLSDMVEVETNRTAQGSASMNDSGDSPEDFAPKSVIMEDE